MGAEQVLTDILSKHPDKIFEIFESMNDIAEKNQGSTIDVQWQQAKNAATAEDALHGLEADARTGYEGWDDTDNGAYTQLYGKRHVPKEYSYFINKIGLPVAGDIAKTIGGVIGARHSILGSAMAAATNNVGNKTDRSGMSDLMKVGWSTGAAQDIAHGAAAKLIGDAVGNRLQQIGDDFEKRDEKARLAQLEMNEHPTGKLYDQMGRMGKI